jgi:hypothetical protein
MLWPFVSITPSKTNYGLFVFLRLNKRKLMGGFPSRRKSGKPEKRGDQKQPLLKARWSNRNPLWDVPRDLPLPAVVEPRHAWLGLPGQVLHVFLVGSNPRSS